MLFIVSQVIFGLQAPPKQATEKQPYCNEFGHPMFCHLLQHDRHRMAVTALLVCVSCRNTCWCFMQNPVTTVAWLVGIFELLGPLISLVIDTKSFCESAIRFKPVICLTVVYLAADLVVTLAQPDSWANLFLQYVTPVAYRRFFAWSILLEGAVYGGLVSIVRVLLQRMQEHRIAAE